MLDKVFWLWWPCLNMFSLIFKYIKSQFNLKVTMTISILTSITSNLVILSYVILRLLKVSMFGSEYASLLWQPGNMYSFVLERLPLILYTLLFI